MVQKEISRVVHHQSLIPVTSFQEQAKRSQETITFHITILSVCVWHVFIILG